MARNQRLRIYQRGDDATLWAECSTDPGHANPYLFAKEETAEEEVDFIKGSAAISQGALEILDKRTVAADQDTGWFTAKLAQNGINAIIGGLAIWDEETTTPGVYDRTLLRGVLGAPALVDDVTYSASIRDIRERERKKKGFTQVTTSTILPPGVENGYGLRNDGSYMVPPATPIAGVYDAATKRISISGFSIDDVPHALISTERKLRAARAVDGVFANIAISWRNLPSGSWVGPVVNMPSRIPGVLTLDYGSAFDGGTNGRATVFGETIDVGYIGSVILYSENPAELPADAASIEFLVHYVGEPSEDYPEHLEGTFGEMLQAACDRHDIEYDAARMAELVARTPRGRIRITKPVEDMRAWIEKQLLRPMGLAPTLNAAFELSPVSHNLPDASVTLVAIDANTIIDGDASWIHSDRRVNAIDFDVIYELYGIDPLQEHAAGDGVEERRQTYERVHGVALNPQLEDRAKYDQDTVRGEWSRLTEIIEQYLPGQTNQILEHRRALLFDRYPVGAQVFEALVFSSIGEQLRLGTWASIAIPWLPDYTTGQRGTNRIGQVVRRQRIDEISWRVWLEDGGPNSVPVSMPTVDSVVVNADGTASITVTPAVGTSARVEFAVGDVEPASTSGQWQTAGRTDATTVFPLFNLPGGKVLYVRARGEKEARRPSAWTTTVATAIASRAGLLTFSIRLNDDGSITAVWTVGAGTAGMRLYYDAHAAGAIPDLSLFVDVDASLGEYTFPVEVVDQAWFTVRAEPWTGFSGGSVSGTAGPTILNGMKVGPAPPTNLVLLFRFMTPIGDDTSNGVVRIAWTVVANWTASPDPLLSHYELRHRPVIWDDVELEWIPDPSGDWTVEPNPRKEDVQAFIYDPIGGQVQVQLRAVDVFGAKSAPISDVIVPGIHAHEPRILDLRETGRTATTVTIAWRRSGSVHRVALFNVLRPKAATPIAWPDAANGDPYTLLGPVTYGTEETRTFDLPDKVHRLLIQLEPIGEDPTIRGTPERMQIIGTSELEVGDINNVDLIVPRLITEAQIALNTLGSNVLAINGVERDNLADRIIDAAKVALGGLDDTDIFGDLIILGRMVVPGEILANHIGVVTLSEIADDIGIVVSGELRNAAGTRYINLDATGAQPFIAHEKFEIRANGDAIFGGTLTTDTVIAGRIIAAPHVTLGGFDDPAIFATGVITAPKLTVEHHSVTGSLTGLGTNAISWTGLSVIYNGVAYAIANGSAASTDNFVWFDRSASTFTATTVFPTINEADGDALIFVKEIEDDASSVWVRAWNQTAILGSGVRTDTIRVRTLSVEVTAHINTLIVDTLEAGTATFSGTVLALDGIEFIDGGGSSLVGISLSFAHGGWGMDVGGAHITLPAQVICGDIGCDGVIADSDIVSLTEVRAPAMKIDGNSILIGAAGTGPNGTTDKMLYVA